MTYDPSADEPLHVTPVDDLKPHVHEGTACPCRPTVTLTDADGNLLSAPVIVHNSWDGREHLEPNEYDDE